MTSSITDLENLQLKLASFSTRLTVADLEQVQALFSEAHREHLCFTFIVRASPLAYSTNRERGRSHYNQKMLFTKLRCSEAHLDY